MTSFSRRGALAAVAMAALGAIASLRLIVPRRRAAEKAVAVEA